MKCNADNVVGSAQASVPEVGRRGRLEPGIHFQETFSEDVAGQARIDGYTFLGKLDRRGTHALYCAALLACAPCSQCGLS